MRERGTITIPSEIREALKIKKYDILHISVDLEGRIVLQVIRE